MVAILPDLNDLFNSLPTSQEKLGYSTDFTRELIAEFDTQRRKMHQELEAQRIVQETEHLCAKAQIDIESAQENMKDSNDQACPKSVSSAKPRKGDRNFKALRKNILHMWRNHEILGKDETANMRRVKSWNTKENQESFRIQIDKKPKFSTWKSFPFATCTEDTTTDL